MDANLIKKLKDMTNAGLMDCKKALEESNENIDEAVKWLREKGISKAAKKQDRIAAEGLSKILVQDNKAIIIEVNCETDFVAKNEKFIAFLDRLCKTILNSDAKTMEDALELKEEDGHSINEDIINMTATIGEKISFRRFAVLEKNDNQTFGEYTHMGGRISALTLVDSASKEVANDVSMHAAAMKPLYVKSEKVPTEALEAEMSIIKNQLLAEGRPEKIIDEKIMPGKIQSYYEEVCLENQKFVKGSGETVAEYVKQNGGSIVDMIRYEVGEGIEKRQDNFVEEVMSQMK